MAGGSTGLHDTMIPRLPSSGRPCALYLASSAALWRLQVQRRLKRERRPLPRRSSKSAMVELGLKGLFTYTLCGLYFHLGTLNGPSGLKKNTESTSHRQ